MSSSLYITLSLYNPTPHYDYIEVHTVVVVEEDTQVLEGLEETDYDSGSSDDSFHSTVDILEQVTTPHSPSNHPPHSL